ncbi:hypothetical protein LXL04_030309 [Taraxacum kok-saghyz]
MIRNNTTKYSSKNLCFVIGIIIYLMATQLVTEARPVNGLEEVHEAENTKKTESRFSSFNIKRGGNLRMRMRNLEYKLASGPSKRGPGH